MSQSAPEMRIVLDPRSGRYVDADPAALRFFGLRLERLRALGGPDAADPSAAAAHALAGALCARAAAGDARSFEWRHEAATGDAIELEVRPLSLPQDAQPLHARLTDIGARRRSERLADGERELLPLIGADAPLPALLERIAAIVDSLCPDFITAISCADARAQWVQEVIGARVPEAWRRVEQGMAVDLRNGSSAAAMYLGRQVLVADIARDPFWQRRGALALELGLCAAWSVPIQAAMGRVLGALTVYRRRCGAPRASEVQLLAHAAQLAALAIERHERLGALRESEARFRSLYESVLDGVYRCSPAGRLLEVNPAFVAMLGYSDARELCELPDIASLYQPREQRAELERRLREQGAVQNVESRLRRADGSSIVVLESARVVCDPEGRLIGIQGTVADISTRKAIEETVFAEKERAQVTLQSIGDAVITTDRDGYIDYLNPAAERLTGWSAADAHGERLGALLRPAEEPRAAQAPGEPPILPQGMPGALAARSPLEEALARCLSEGQVVHSAERGMLLGRAGRQLAVQASAAPIRDRDAGIIGAVVVFRDVTKEHRLRRALSYQASHDALTGLINRREFDNRLTEALASAREREGPHALLYMDLDQFKLVNDSYGHGAGDRLLRDVTGLLHAHVRAGDTIARLGGDEFGILLRCCTAAQGAEIGEAIRRAVHDYRFIWDQAVNRIGVSIGVVEITAYTPSVATLLSAADVACYAAKDAGRNRVHVHDAQFAGTRARDLRWVERITQALGHGRLELYAQPIVPIGAARAPARGGFYEVLTRLRDEDGELVLPRQFLPAAERYNVVGNIDRWVLRGVLGALRAHAAAQPGEPEPPCLFALNLSGASLGERAFLEFALGEIDSRYLARGLCFEVSEAAVLRNLTEAVEFMRELRQRGCRFALAEFGAELSSFRSLRSLPVDFIKLEPACTARAAADPLDACILESVGRAAHALGIATIAEKVESTALINGLQRSGIDLAQGLALGAPAPLGLLVEPLQPAPLRATAAG